MRPGEIHQLRPVPALEPFETLWWHVTAGGINLTIAGFAGERHKARGGFVPLASSPVQAITRAVRELEGDRARRGLLVRATLLDLAARILRPWTRRRRSPPRLPGERKGAGTAAHRAIRGGALQRRADAGAVRTLAGLSRPTTDAYLRPNSRRVSLTFLGDVRHREATALCARLSSGLRGWAQRGV